MISERDAVKRFLDTRGDQEYFRIRLLFSLNDTFSSQPRLISSWTFMLLDSYIMTVKIKSLCNYEAITNVGIMVEVSAYWK